jgi:hypothetical protein
MPVVSYAHPQSRTPILSSDFFSFLFDLSFSKLLTSRLIRIWFVVSIVFSAAGSLVIGIVGFGMGFRGVPFLIFILILFFTSVIFVRVVAEVLIVVFRMTEYLAEIAKQGRQA